MRLPHLAIDKDKLAEFNMYDTELKQLLYLLYAQLIHQTRERKLTLERGTNLSPLNYGRFLDS